MKWGLPPWDGKSMGKVCYYGRRVWRANYSAALSLEKLILRCNPNKPLFDALSSLVPFSVNKMAAARLARRDDPESRSMPPPRAPCFPRSSAPA
jgi:hypothetical protein